MKSRAATLLLACAALGGLALVVSGLRANAPMRAVTVAWMTDPARHVDPNFVQVTATSDVGEDVAISVRLVHVSSGSRLPECTVTVDPDTPFDSVDDPVIAKYPLTAYASGTPFTAVAEFRDASGTLTGTATAAFVKP